MAELRSVGTETTIRFATAAAVWICRAFVGDESPSRVVAGLILDVAVVSLLWRATKPMERVYGKKFGQANSPTSLLLLPIALAFVFFLRDIWTLFQSK